MIPKKEHVEVAELIKEIKRDYISSNKIISYIWVFNY